MLFASDKNFPKFIHTDTLIKTSDISFLNKNSEPPQKNYFFLPKYSPSKSIHYKNNLSNLTSEISTTLEKKPLQNMSYSFAYKHEEKTPEKVFPSIKSKKFTKICENDVTNEFDERFANKLRKFQNLMSYHSNSKVETDLYFTNITKKKKKFKHCLINRKINAISLIPLNPITNSKKNTTKIPIKYRASKESFNTPSCVRLALANSPDDNLNYTSNSKKTPKISIFSDLTATRIKNIPFYKELIPVLKKLEINLNDYLTSLGHNERTSKMLKNLLSKKIKMSHLFFNEKDGKLWQSFNLFNLEEKCIKKEQLYENGKIVKKDSVDPLLISELTELNKKLEDFNNQKEIDDLKCTKDSLLNEYKRMKKIESDNMCSPKSRKLEFLPKFNFEIMPNIQFMKIIDDFERQHGECDLINKRNKTISRVLEDMVGEIKKTAHGYGEINKK